MPSVLSARRSARETAAVLFGPPGSESDREEKRRRPWGGRLVRSSPVSSGEHVFVLNGPAGRSAFTFRAPCRVALGRTPDNAIAIADPSVSRRHAALHVADEVEIEDLGSENGTWVHELVLARSNETPMVSQRRLERGERYVLAPGRLVTIGATTLAVASGGGESESAAGDPLVLDPEMKRVYELAAKVARGPIAVLLLGETGVGKEILARAIHDASPRRTQPFVAINCAAIPETLLESELFGHERGAFTGALAAKPGLIEAADRGTVFLDEIGDIPAAMQARLLRVLEEGTVQRVGSVKPMPVDVRFVAATHRDLEEAIAAGSFRRDLFYRVSGMTLRIPPLRERRTEIAPLARRFVTKLSSRLGTAPPRLSSEAEAALESHAWPGNVRELRNVLERACLVCESGVIGPEHLFLEPPQASSARATAPPPSAGSLRAEAERLDRQRIVDALHAAGGNQTKAARALGITRRVLTRALDRYQLPRPRR
jgi:DNA-binding NtrC family response regulator